MKYKNPNLARQPFVNKRPVVRVSALLWVLGAALFAVNVSLYWNFTRGQDVKREQLLEIRSAIEREQDLIRELQDRISGIDLSGQNEQVAFLNQKINERTFGWSLLFDTLAEVLPDDVRLGRLSLTDGAASRSARGGRTRRVRMSEEGPMHFGIQGEARNFEALLDFMDALYASEIFDNVDLSRDSREGSLFRFQLDVTYYPSRAAAAYSAKQQAKEEEATGMEGEGTEPAGEGTGEPAAEDPAEETATDIEAPQSPSSSPAAVASASTPPGSGAGGNGAGAVAAGAGRLQ